MPPWRAPARCRGHRHGAVPALPPVSVPSISVPWIFVPCQTKSLTARIFLRYGTKINKQETVMELFFAPLACSMATRIALYEADAPATFRQVDTRTKRVADGSDFLSVNPMGQVPALRTDNGELLTENPVVLQY